MVFRSCYSQRETRHGKVPCGHWQQDDNMQRVLPNRYKSTNLPSSQQYTSCNHSCKCKNHTYLYIFRTILLPNRHLAHTTYRPSTADINYFLTFHSAVCWLVQWLLMGELLHVTAERGLGVCGYPNQQLNVSHLIFYSLKTVVKRNCIQSSYKYKIHIQAYLE